MRIRKLNLLIIFGLALAPAIAGAQQGDPAARIDAALAAAARAEIPVALIESKIDEGRAKGVAEARIAAAVEARLNALIRASNALESAGARAVTAGELSVAADAIQGGVSETALAEVMTGAPAERRAVATAVLTELVALGVASDAALASVQAAMTLGGEALVNLPAQARGRIGAGANGAGSVNIGPPAGVDAGIRGGIQIPGAGSDGTDGRPGGLPVEL